jgi:hypothetical protein
VLCLCPEHLTAEENDNIIEALGRRGIEFTVLPACDDPSYRILGADLETARRVATEAREASGALMVQCWGGCNRAPTVGMALLMLLDGMPLVHACASVRAVRGEVLTNKGFRRQLLQLAEDQGLLQELTLPKQLPCGHGRRYRWDSEVVEDFLHLLHVCIVDSRGLMYPDSTGKTLGAYLDDIAAQHLWHRHSTLVRRWMLVKVLLGQLQ